jgi:hypothetical protein
MKSRKLLLLLGIIAPLAVGIVVFAWNTYEIQISERPVKPLKPPFSSLGKCGVENCHGLEITCGPNIPEICDTMGALSDNCRQYAHCQVIGEECQLVKDTKFDECKSCIEKCEKDFINDPIKVFDCGGKCIL